MARNSSKDQWAFTPLLHSLGTAAAVVLAVIATTFLTEFLLCIALSTGPVVVVVRGIGAFICSVVRHVSSGAQFTKQVAVDVFRSLAATSSSGMKLIIALVVCVTTAAAAAAPTMLTTVCTTSSVGVTVS